MTDVNITEKQIEDYLCRNNNLYKHLGLKFLARQYQTPVGIVDIIGYNPSTKRFVIIELKKDLLDHNAFFQLERYRHFFMQKADERLNHKLHRQYAANDDSWFKNSKIPDYTNFDCLLIGKNLHQNLHYSVEYWCGESDISQAYRFWYRCFGYSLERAITFDYFNPRQREVEGEYYESI